MDLAVHPAKDQMDKSGRKLPAWDTNEAEEQSVGESPWALDYTRKVLGFMGRGGVLAVC